MTTEQLIESVVRGQAPGAAIDSLAEGKISEIDPKAREDLNDLMFDLKLAVEQLDTGLGFAGRDARYVRRDAQDAAQALAGIQRILKTA